MTATRRLPTELQQLSILIATCCVDMIGFAMILPLLPYYALKLHATPELIGLMTATFSVAQLIAAPYWGRLSDRYGRRPVLLIGLSASAVAYVIFGLASSVWLLFLSRLVQGAGGGTTGVAQAYVADTIKPAGRAKALGWLSAATSAGVAIGPAIGSFSHAHLGPAAPGFVAAALCLINVAFAWRWLPESRVPAPASGGAVRRPVWAAAADVLEHPARPVSRLIWIYGVGMFAFSCLTSVLALFLDARFGVTEETIGYFYSYIGALSFTMRSLFLGPIVSRFGETRTMRYGTAILVAGLVLYTVAPNVWALAFIIPLVPIGTALLFPSTTALMSRASPKEQLGTTMGVAQTFAGVARVAAPLLATGAFQRIGHAAPFYLAAATVTLVGLMALRVEPVPFHGGDTGARAHVQGIRMSDDDRIERLEQRLQVLEGLVRQVMASRSVSPPPGSELRGATAEAPPAARPVMPTAPARPAAPLPPPPRPAVPRASVSSAVLSEQWLGQRGLLAVGVTFMILAAGYLLKLSFDRGWVSPLIRCITGALAGAGIGLLGWQLHARGTRTYGAALIGCGAAVLYLAVWAATRLYQFLPPTSAIVALALVSISLAAVALAIDVQALLASAALGAFFAPIVIGKEGGSVDLLLLYLGAMGAALGWVAARRHWRLATFIVALAYFGIASAGILPQADPVVLYLYAILGGGAGLFVGLREAWFETRFLAFGGGWAVLGVANNASSTHWPTLLGGIVLTVPVWWRALTANSVWPRNSAGQDPGRIGFGDSFYFYLSPLLLGAALREVAPGWFDAHDGLLPALIALPYLVAGLTAVRRPFALVAAIALGGAALVRWPGLEAVWGLLLLTVAWAAVDHLLRRLDGGRYALLSLAAALLHLLLTDLPTQPELEHAFTGPWALALWGTLAVTLALAAGLLREEPVPGPRLRPMLWALAGGLLFFGLTGELVQYFTHTGLDDETAHLAGGLAVSAWWILYAAGCFFLGFRRQIAILRQAGFAVVGLALAKVLLVDLARLDALYRVGSFLIVSLVTLAVAYAYHRKGQRDAGAA